MLGDKVRKLALVILVIVSGAAWFGEGIIKAQEKKEYKLTEVQLLRLQVKQKDAQIAQVRFQASQQAFQAAINDLQAEASKVKEQNQWDKDVVFNADALTFSEAPKPAKDPKDSKEPNGNNPKQ